MKIIVNGIARSGTSMLMLMLQEGGIPIYYDSKPKGDICNPNGYFEHSAVFKHSRRPDNRWPEVEGKALKVCGIEFMKRVIPKDESYKVIHIERDPVEVSASHEKFIEINGILPHRTIEDIEAEVEQTKEYLKDMDVLYMRYGDIIKNPAGESRRIAVFLGMDLDIQAMANVVDLHLYRNRNVFMMRKEKSSDAS